MKTRWERKERQWRGKVCLSYSYKGDFIVNVIGNDTNVGTCKLLRWYRFIESVPVEILLVSSVSSYRELQANNNYYQLI